MSEFSQRVLVPFSCWQISGWSRWGIHVFGLAFLMLATTSCGRWADLKPDDPDAPAGYKTTSAETFFKEERKYYKDPSAPPQYCLALSGGGIRSAAYSIGVLKGLHARGELDKVDIISAVSGGSYAATWLYAEKARLETSGSDKEFLSTKSIREVAGKARPFVLQLGASGIQNVGGESSLGFFATVADWISGLVIYTGGALWSYLPPRSEGHETTTGADYKKLIEGTFHSRPDSGDRLSIQRTFKDLPYLIVNATVQDADKSGPLANRVFEFTSHGMGSPSTGYKSWAELSPENRVEPASLSTIASISGAAVDKSTVTILNVVGRDLGLAYAMLTPDYDGGMIKRFLLLTDGGESENLGVYGLIKRGCKEILVVDAEYDGRPDSVKTFFTRLIEYFTEKTIVGYEDSYQFDGYGTLNKNLRKESKALKINDLDAVIQDLEDQKNQGTTSDTKTSLQPWNCWSEPVKIKRKTFECAEPINTGHVHRCRDKECKEIEKLDMHVTYVKLSANRELLDKSSNGGKDEAEDVYGPGIMKFYKKETTKETTEAKKVTDFPHYLTHKFVWEKEQFLAIAELGCRTVMRHSLKWGSIFPHDQKNAPKVLRQSEAACALIE